MEVENLKNGIECTIMRIIMTWESLIRILSMLGQFLEALLSTLILTVAEHEGHQQKTDAKSESRLPLIWSLNIYIPRDEQFGHLKLSDFLAYALKSIAQVLLPEFEALADNTPTEFDTFEDVVKLYEGGVKLPEGPALDNIKEKIPIELLKELIRTDGEGYARFPMPKVIKEDKSAWRTDEEFAREMLAGVNPVNTSLLKEFPSTSTLDPNIYGDHSSSITRYHIENCLDGLTVD